MNQTEILAVKVSQADWQRDAMAIAEVRRRVFIEEQGVPEAMEWEGSDADCAWFIARNSTNQVVGVARLMPAGRVGRMAVLPGWRRRGIGSALLQAALALASEQGLGEATAHAQCHALPFYLGHGFRVEGEEFEEAGIPHRKIVFRIPRKA